jgi:excisionase family DNA binding protein
MLLTVSQVAERLGLSRQRIYVLVNTQRIAAERFGKTWLIDDAELKRFKPKPIGYPKGRPRH